MLPSPHRRGARRIRRLARPAAALAAVCLVGCGGRSGPPPNLLLITIEALRADRLGCYGGPAETGGAVCSVAEQGTRFRWAFSTASDAAPSLASILTSRYPAFHRVSARPTSRMAAEARSVAQVLSEAGYATAAVVSGSGLEHRGFERGFDHFDLQPGPTAGGRDAMATCDAALAWLQAEARAPWFLWVHVGDLGVDQQAGGAVGASSSERSYLEALRRVDAELARLVSGASGPGDASAVLVAGAHGESLGEDGFARGHGHSLGLEQIRVPLVWREPGGARGAVVGDPVSLLDVAPTLLRAADAGAPPTFQGTVLPGPGLAGGLPGESRPIFAESQARVALVLDRSYYARDRQHGGAEPERASTLPWRTAQLPDRDGALPPYSAARGSEAVHTLDRLVSSFLERTSPASRRLSESRRER